MCSGNYVLVSDQEGSSVRVLMFLDWWVVKPCHDLTQPIVRMTSNVNHHLALIALCILIILLIFFLVIIKFAWIVVVFFSGPDRFLRGWNVRQVSRFEELQLFVVWSWVFFRFCVLRKVSWTPFCCSWRSHKTVTYDWLS